MNKTITHTLFFCISILSPSLLSAQKLYGNEWIIFSQTYLRVPVVENGLYKICTAELQQAGFPVDPRQSAGFQMFWRGKEVAIQVNGAGQSHIIFQGQRNDGALDSALYVKPATIPHTRYSLYSDTSAYFLTWNAADISGKRTDFDSTKVFDSLGYHFAEVEKLFVSHYAPGNFYPPETGFNDGSALSGYDVGEGWTGPEIEQNASYSFSLGIKEPLVERFSEAQIELVLAGRSMGSHAYELWSSDKSGLKRKIRTFRFDNFESLNFKALLAPSDFSTETELGFTLVAAGNEGTISLSYAKLRFPQKVLEEPANQGEPIDILKPRVVKFPNIEPQTFNYLIITHPAVRTRVENVDPVLAYAEYRASAKGGGYQPLIIDSQDVYDQFNYGEPGPSGIRNMISWLSQAGNLQFVFLIGRSTDPQTARKSPNARTLDMVPNAGWPGSDIALVTEANTVSGLNPIVPIGRLNAFTSQNVHDYLSKVKAMEAEPASAPWRKNILHLSGGRSMDEIAVFSDYVKSFEQRIKNSALAASVATISKKTTDPVEKLSTYIPINKGVGLVTFFGHSSLDVTDVDIGLASDPNAYIKNHPRYPAIIINGCAAGSIFYSNKSMSNDWILNPNSGAVLFLAHTFNGLSTDLKHYTDRFYEVLTDSAFAHKSFGIIQNEAIRRNLISHKNITAIITAQQMVLHGDPAIRIFPAIPPTSHSTNITITVSPNPSHQWFRFSVAFGSSTYPQKANLLVYDLWGRKVKEITFETYSGKNEWLWYPENLPSGVYLYSLEIEQINRTIVPAVQKVLQGKLIWVH
ncbi:C25 family cysteine peptidase [Dyadobacter chenwenxiniae]|uniref:C25 family cysteine peptidase n=1 Tax=Dyadobacter chenwenxiniae TaxID=2906456 RepID=A0A9X1TKY3_9BACT|nr:C25 family cysteine peptidase [Dyadobacter chenwenxiniae]MCF0061693.1 C25 family cysteine peptidase [Dyadobacter chenwenxiniae]UON81513.1 C25 family cysteine peptidase [Dyadobacter chenwenxiniae]